MGNTSSSIPVQGVMDFLIVSSFYQPSFESPKSFKVRHEQKKRDKIVCDQTASYTTIKNLKKTKNPTSLKLFRLIAVSASTKGRKTCQDRV